MATIAYHIVDIDKSTGYGELEIKLTITRDVRRTFRTGLFVFAEYFQVVKTTESGNVFDVVAPRINKKKTNVDLVEETRRVRDELHIFASKILRICEHFQSYPGFKITKEYILEALEHLKEFKNPTEEMTYLHVTEVLGGTSFINNIWSGGQPFFKLLTIMLKDKANTSTNPEHYTRNYMALSRVAKRFELYTRLSDGSKREFVLDPRTMTCATIESFRYYMMTESDLYLAQPDIFAKIAEINPDCMSCVIHRHQTIRKKNENYIKTMLEYLKTFFHWINNMDYTDNWPFKGFVVGDPKYETPFFLTIEERNLVADYDLSASPRLSVLRDAFIFQCLTGCRFSDLSLLKRKNVKKGILRYIPKKTSGRGTPVMATVPLCNRAIKMMKRNYSKGGSGEDLLFDLPSHKNYDVDLQAILTICGIQRPVLFRDPKTGGLSYKPICEVATSHIARKTFIGNAYKMVKDPDLIGKMSGHIEGSRSFNRYRTISDDDLREIISKIG